MHDKERCVPSVARIGSKQNELYSISQPWSHMWQVGTKQWVQEEQKTTTTTSKKRRLRKRAAHSHSLHAWPLLQVLWLPCLQLGCHLAWWP
jgi:hypothetical protein